MPLEDQNTLKNKQSALLMKNGASMVQDVTLASE